MGHPPVLPHLGVASESVRSWGQRRNQMAFTSPTPAIDVEAARDLLAVAFRVSRAVGLYTAVSVVMLITFGDCMITEGESQTTDFRISRQD